VDDRTECFVSKFEDGTEVGGGIDTPGRCGAIQWDVERLD